MSSKQVLSSWRSSIDGTLVEQDLRVCFHPEDGSYELETSQEKAMCIELGVNPHNDSQTVISKIVDAQLLSKFVSVGDLLLCVNDHLVVDEGLHSITQILDTLSLSTHPRKLRFLNTKKHSLSVFFRRFELEKHGKMTDLLGFVISMEEHLLEEQRRQETIQSVHQRDRDWVDYLKAIGGVENLKPAGLFKPSQDLKFMVRRGIPVAYRAAIWKKISLSSLLQQKRYPVDYYRQLLERVGEIPKKVNDDIEKDVDRTFPEHIYFRHSGQGLASLRRVLQAFALHQPEIGYCQSLNFVAGMMLIFMEEEDAFFLLITVVEQLLPKDYYTKSMVGTYVDQFVLAHIIKKFLPKIHATLEKNQLQLPLITVQWFMCIFVNTLRPEVTLRVWDIFLNEGNKVLFRIAAALFKLNEARLCAVRDAGELFQTLREIGKNVSDPELLIATAYKSYTPSARQRSRTRSNGGSGSAMMSMKTILGRPPRSLGAPPSTSSSAAASAAKNMRHTSASHISPRLQPMSDKGAVPRDLLGLGLAHLGPADALDKYREASKAWSLSMASRTESVAAASASAATVTEKLRNEESAAKERERESENENDEETKSCENALSPTAAEEEEEHKGEHESHTERAQSAESERVESEVATSSASLPLSPQSAPFSPFSPLPREKHAEESLSLSPATQSDAGSSALDLCDPTFADPALLFQNVAELALSPAPQHAAFHAHNQSVAYQEKLQRRQRKARAGQFAFYRADIALWRSSFRPGLEERFHKMEKARKSYKRSKSRTDDEALVERIVGVESESESALVAPLSLLHEKVERDDAAAAAVKKEEEEEESKDKTAMAAKTARRPSSLKAFIRKSFSKDDQDDVLDTSSLHYDIDHSFVREERNSVDKKQFSPEVAL